MSKTSRSGSDCNRRHRSSRSSSAHLPSRLLRLVFDTAALRCRRTAVLLAIAGVFLHLGLPTSAAESTDVPLNIVVLYSGDVFIPAAVTQDRAMRQAVTVGTSNSVNFYLESLHEHQLSQTDFDDNFVSFVRRKYRDQKIDLVILGGTSALNFFERHRSAMWPGTPAMFYSVDESFRPHRELSPGITGVTIKLDPGGTLDLARRLQPNARRVVVITGISEVDRSWIPVIRTNLQSRHPDMVATFLTNHTVSELTEEVQKLPPDAIVLFTSVLQDASGKRFIPRDVAARLATVSKAPLYGLYETMLDHGIVGGAWPSLEAHGRRAGELALRLLAGQKPDDIPIGPAASSVPVVDYRQLKRWAISESRLSPGTTIYFRQPTLWEAYRGFVIGGSCIFAAQSATITALWLQRNRRRLAEREARDSEEEMSLAADAANLGMWVWDILLDRLWASERCKQIYGYPADAEVTFEMLSARVHPEDKAIRKERIKQAIAEGGRYDLQYRLLLPNGNVRWLAVAARVETDTQGKATRMLGASIDITERRNAEASARELGGRLINAQEDERRRIARDLHDDLNQRLALLSVEMEMLKESGNRGNSTGASSLDRMGAQVKDISSDVHKLAYQLHPAKLDQLGLVAAARSLCRDLTRQSGIEIGFTTEGVPDGIPQQLALCCYRVMQESLGNVVRHSGAKEARVELRTVGSQLLLIVSDEGKGFDVEATRAVSGLGLVSMNERVRLMNGRFEIGSTPGKGTRMELSLPLPAAVVNSAESAKLESERCT